MGGEGGGQLEESRQRTDIFGYSVFVYILLLKFPNFARATWSAWSAVSFQLLRIVVSYLSVSVLCLVALRVSHLLRSSNGTGWCVHSTYILRFIPLAIKGIPCRLYMRSCVGGSGAGVCSCVCVCRINMNEKLVRLNK